MLLQSVSFFSPHETEIIRLKNNTRQINHHKKDRKQPVVGCCIPSPKVADQVDELTVSVLVQMIYSNVSEQVLCPSILDAYPSLLNQLLDKEVLASDGLHSRAVGPLRNYMKSRGIVDTHWYTVEACVDFQLLHYA